MAVDGSGNVYIVDGVYSNLYKWTTLNNLVTTVMVNLCTPMDVAMDPNGNVYVVDSIDGRLIWELPSAFVNTAPISEPLGGGSDVLLPVVPRTANLIGSFTPTGDQPWLTITGITNGVVTFSFTENINPTRTAYITLFGQPVSIIQSGPAFSLDTNVFLVGQFAGSDSVVVTVTPNFGTWTATANAAWLHVSPANQSGTRDAAVVFSYDANPYLMTRIGTLTKPEGSIILGSSVPQNLTTKSDLSIDFMASQARFLLYDSTN